MPLMDHLGELRRRLTIIIVSLFASACVLYFATPTLIQFLVAPVSEYFNADALGAAMGDDSATGLVVTTALGGFSIRFRVAIFCAFCVCSPLVLWEILAFFLPALKPNERKWVIPTLVAGVFLFIFGIVFCYNFTLGAAFGWLMGESNAIGTLMPDAESYIKTILGLLLAFGIAFELPLVVFYLSVFNIVPYKTFRSNWRTVYVVLLVICAMVTPDASPVTMFFMFAALIMLYEASLLVSSIVIKKRIAKQKADGTYFEDDEDEDDDDEDDEESEDDRR